LVGYAVEAALPPYFEARAADAYDYFVELSPAGAVERTFGGRITQQIVTGLIVGGFGDTTFDVVAVAVEKAASTRGEWAMPS